MPRRLSHLKRLAKIYVNLKTGDLINKHLELHRIFTIKNSKYPEHPHKETRVYISRRSLKHFVESRKHELGKRHSVEQITEIICFALDSLQETITNFDVYELEPPKHFYIRDYSHVGKPQLRVLLEHNEDRLEIISIHFKTRRAK